MPRRKLPPFGARFHDLAKQYKQDLVTLLHNIVTTWLATNTKYKALVWEQSVPVFNDGDPCQMCVSDILFLPADEASGEALCDSEFDYGTPEHEIAHWVSQDHNLLEWLFGSNSIVTITSDKVEVEKPRNQ